ncbi:MAG: class I SAM-dependent rRNA methyltransferase [Nitrospirae bacterium]|nr:class I SAM-dependent rRNA methyltransferase [Nitrospirota bacterium]
MTSGSEPTSERSVPRVRLKPRESRRIKRGHRWIFSNEIADPVKDLPPGSLVDVVDERGALVGRGYVNPQSLITIRLLAPAGREIDAAFFRGRLAAARSYRERICGPRTAGREVFGEADGLPGLIVDRYGPFLVVQSLAAGIEVCLPMILDLLEEIHSPRAIVLRNDSPARGLEGLPAEVRVARGRLDSEGGIVETEVDGLAVEVDLLAGQKTGWFLDQSENRRCLAEYANGRRVLDAFCYAGAWGLAAIKAGAAEVLAVDSSAPAVSAARRNAERNRVGDRFRAEEASVFDRLRRLDSERSRFDLVVLDPPAFIKSGKKVAEGVRGYREINRLGLRLLAPGGILVSSSCSHHLPAEEFLAVLRRAAADTGRTVKLLEFRGQARDHPVLLSMPETSYLKCAFLCVE